MKRCYGQTSLFKQMSESYTYNIENNVYLRNKTLSNFKENMIKRKKEVVTFSLKTSS